MFSRDICAKCKVKITNMNNSHGFSYWLGDFNAWFCDDCDYISFINKKNQDNEHKYLLEFIQPERSKREDSQECEMRCSEHCGNTVSHK